MKPILIAGSITVTLALVSYSIAFFTFHRKKTLSGKVLFFQTLGLLLDITATAFMITGSSKGAFTLHGFIGYSSLTLMIFDTVFFWNQRNREVLPTWLTAYSRIAYVWWIIAYLTGSLLVMIR